MQHKVVQPQFSGIKLQRKTENLLRSWRSRCGPRDPFVAGQLVRVQSGESQPSARNHGDGENEEAEPSVVCSSRGKRPVWQRRRHDAIAESSASREGAYGWLASASAPKLNPSRTNDQAARYAITTETNPAS